MGNDTSRDPAGPDAEPVPAGGDGDTAPPPTEDSWKRPSSRKGGEWSALLEDQHGVVSRSQAEKAGITRAELSHLVNSGRWQRVYQGVYATFTGELSHRATLWAVILRAGRGAAFSHETAAELHNFAEPDPEPDSPIHVTVPSRRRPGQRETMPGVVIHRATTINRDVVPSWEPSRVTAGDTVLDLVEASATFDEAYTWISRATSRQKVAVATIRDAAAGRKRLRWRDWLNDALEDASDGIYFALERRYFQDIERAHGLPKSTHQESRVIDGKTHHKDALYADYRVCVELDGAAYHENEQVLRDKRRDNANLAVDNVETFRFGWVDVTELACDSAAMVAGTLRRKGWTGRPHPCGQKGCRIPPP